MAQKTITQLVDDLDDTPLEAGAGQTVSFSIGSQAYEIDLTDEHADELREAFSRYVNAGRKVGGRAAPRTSAQTKPATSDVSPRAVREWAKANKVQLSPRGRIPQSVIDQFKAAGN